MSARFALWAVTDRGPERLDRAQVELEKQIEEVLARNPGMLPCHPTIIGRQLQTAAGPLDLLGLDVQGRLILVEVKRAAVDRACAERNSVAIFSGHRPRANQTDEATTL